MWVNADQKEIDQHPKLHDGWELEDDIYNIVWFEGQQLPDTLVSDESDTASNVVGPNDGFLPSSEDEAEDLGSDEEIIEDSE